MPQNGVTGDQNQKNRFENTKTGYRVVVPMSAGTGERGDYVVVMPTRWYAPGAWVWQSEHKGTHE